VYDSFEIAVYLDEAYPSRPGLFEGTESRALSLFMHHWAFRSLHPPLLRAILLDLYRHLHEKDKAYFRESREKRLGGRLEEGRRRAQEVARRVPRRARAAAAGAGAEPFVAGKGPGFADYIVFGTFQWARAVSPLRLLEARRPAVQVARAHAGSLSGVTPARPRGTRFGFEVPFFSLGASSSSDLLQYIELLVDPA
jgi:glutathione S-transferase